MSLEIAKKGILFLQNHSVDIPEVFVGFYGEEPLLEFSLLQELVYFSESVLRGKKINYMLTTNATLLNEHMIDFFVKYNFNITISIDGSRDAHNKNRIFSSNGKGTFEIIIERLKLIHQKWPLFFKTITINVVMDPSTDFDEINALFSEYPFMKKFKYYQRL